ncbi:MAG: hypothetical protein IPM53_19955 [Anaerolineaceae bacterium]|nr:hypothetical protein [Anaerolineaceae bacterium]
MRNGVQTCFEKHLLLRDGSGIGDAVPILVFEKASELKILIPVLAEEAVPLHIHSIVEAQLLTRTHSGGER